MVISRIPYQVPFFGEWTDNLVWYREIGGKVLATTIDRYLHINWRHLLLFLEHQLGLAYSEFELFLGQLVACIDTLAPDTWKEGVKNLA